MGDTAAGRAGMTHGSQLQVQTYVNRFPGELTGAVLEALPSLAKRTRRVLWTAPLEAEAFAEPQDTAFLSAVGRGDLSDELRTFWPAGGPVWDALAVAVFDSGPPGVVLAEGKAHPHEFSGPGSKATEPARAQISKALAATQRWLGLAENPEAWLGPLYQSANRLAHLYWLREVVNVEAWLVHLVFLDDHTHKATSQAEWDEALPKIDHELGLARRSEFAWHAFLPALAADELSRKAATA